jgi:hypothetical protein
MQRVEKGWLVELREPKLRKLEEESSIKKYFPLT